jgi:hypothetical protein
MLYLNDFLSPIINVPLNQYTLPHVAQSVSAQFHFPKTRPHQVGHFDCVSYVRESRSKAGLSPTTASGHHTFLQTVYGELEQTEND